MSKFSPSEACAVFVARIGEGASTVINVASLIRKDEASERGMRAIKEQQKTKLYSLLLFLLCHNKTERIFLKLKRHPVLCTASLRSRCSSHIFPKPFLLFEIRPRFLLKVLPSERVVEVYFGRELQGAIFL